MIGMNQLNVKAAQLDVIACLDAVDLDLLGHAVLLKLGTQDTCHQTRAIDRNIQLFEHIRQCTDVILMAVRDDNAAHLVLVPAQIRDIRNDQIDAQQIIVRKRHAAVNDKNVLSVLHDRHVLADLIESAQRYNLQFFFHKCVPLSFT